MLGGIMEGSSGTVCAVGFSFVQSCARASAYFGLDENLELLIGRYKLELRNVKTLSVGHWRSFGMRFGDGEDVIFRASSILCGGSEEESCA